MNLPGKKINTLLVPRHTTKLCLACTRFLLIRFCFLGKFCQLAVFRGKFILDFSLGERKSGRLTEVAVLKMAVLWGNFIKGSLGSWQGNGLLAVLWRWPSYRVAVLRGSTVSRFAFDRLWKIW